MAPVGAVEGHALCGNSGRRQAWNDVNQEQPVPGIILGNPAADEGADRRGQHGKATTDDRGERLLTHREHQKRRRENNWDDGAAEKTLDEAEGVEHFVGRRSRAGDAGGDEAQHGGDEQPARGHHAGAEPGQRNGDDFGDQIGGMDVAEPRSGDFQLSWMSISELATIWISRIAKNMPAVMAEKPSQLRKDELTPAPRYLCPQVWRPE